MLDRPPASRAAASARVPVARHPHRLHAARIRTARNRWAMSAGSANPRTRKSRSARRRRLRPESQGHETSGSPPVGSAKTPSNTSATMSARAILGDHRRSARSSQQPRDPLERHSVGRHAMRLRISEYCRACSSSAEHIACCHLSAVSDGNTPSLASVISVCSVDLDRNPGSRPPRTIERSGDEFELAMPRPSLTSSMPCSRP